MRNKFPCQNAVVCGLLVGGNVFEHLPLAMSLIIGRRCFSMRRCTVKYWVVKDVLRWQRLAVSCFLLRWCCYVVDAHDILHSCIWVSIAFQKLIMVSGKLIGNMRKNFLT